MLSLWASQLSSQAASVKLSPPPRRSGRPEHVSAQVALRPVPREGAGAGLGADGPEGAAPKAPRAKSDYESGREITNNLLASGDIATPNPRLEPKDWPSWTCTHCKETYNPGANFTNAVHNSDVSKDVNEHFTKYHCEGKASAYECAAPKKYAALYGEGSERPSEAQALRSVFGHRAKGLWKEVRRPRPPPPLLASEARREM